MAQVTVTIPDSDFSSTTTTIRWITGVSLGNTLSADGAEQSLSVLSLPEANSASTVSIGINGDDRDFTTQMENNGSITLTNAAGTSIEIAMGNDTEEPYTWTPSNLTDIRAWSAATRALSNRAITALFDDSPTPQLPDASAPTITIAAVGSVAENSTQSLTTSVSGGEYDVLGYVWEVVSGGGSIVGVANGSSATYTPPDVSVNTQVTVRVTVTASGFGLTALDNTSDTSSDDESFTVTAVLPDTGTITIRAMNSEGTNDWTVAYTIT